MRRSLCTVLIIVILIMGVCHAESARTSDDELFISAIELLKQTKNRQSLADAQEMLESIESNYNLADMFAAYASVLVDLHDEKLEDAQIKLGILSRNQTFIDLLSEYELPGCDVVAEYIKARLAELDGRYDEALELYTSISFFDSLARSFDLVGREKQQAYEAACDLFDKGMFVEAAEAFDALGQYKDSVERAEESRAHVTPEPTPTPTPSPSPTPTPVPTPTPESTPESSTSEIIDSRHENFLDIYECDTIRSTIGGDFWEIDIVPIQPIYPPSLIDASWADDDLIIYTDYDTDDTIRNQEAKKGKTQVQVGDGEYYIYDNDWELLSTELCWFEIYLPDNKDIAGEQTITIKIGNEIVTVSVNLTYYGKYEDDLGWGVEYLGYSVRKE